MREALTVTISMVGLIWAASAGQASIKMAAGAESAVSSPTDVASLENHESGLTPSEQQLSSIRIRAPQFVLDDDEISGRSLRYREVRCESRNMEPKICHLGAPVREAFIVHSFSGSKNGCEEGTTWFRRSESLQVTRGCRAIFGVVLDR